MKLSTRFRYGTRLMINLALNYNKGPVILKSVAKTEKVSKKYLEQIVIKLMSANLVKSVRGPKGGYVLAKPPNKIKIIEIYNILEKTPVLVPCLKRPSVCSLVKTCTAREMWQKMQEDIFSQLTKNTLSDLAKQKLN